MYVCFSLMRDSIALVWPFPFNFREFTKVRLQYVLNMKKNAKRTSVKM